MSEGPAVTLQSLTTLAGEAAYGLALCAGLSTFGALRTNRAARYHHA